MIVNKLIHTTELQEIKIAGITLLSTEEYKAYKDNIPKVDFAWWLRSLYVDAHHDAGFVAIVGFPGFATVDTHIFARPALYLESSNLQIGDKFKLARRTWTVISKEYALCDDDIGRCSFREDWRAEDANDYEASDIKMFIEIWAKENEILCQ